MSRQALYDRILEKLAARHLRRQLRHLDHQLVALNGSKKALRLRRERQSVEEQLRVLTTP